MIVYSDKFLLHDMPSHPENCKRLKYAMEFLKKKNVAEKIKIKEPQEASEEELLLVHDKEHIKFIKAASSGGGTVMGDTYITPYTYDVAKLAAGAGISCVNSPEKNCFALIRPPGHHATSSSAMGFCIFNNAAVAATTAIKKGAKKVAIVDIDLHHGNGTQEIFYESSEVLYCSLHQSPLYPGTGLLNETGAGEGEGFTVNFPLPPGTANQSYLKAFNEIFIPVIREFDPDRIIVSAGFDAHYMDFLGELKLSTSCYFGIAKALKMLDKKLIYLLEGGYNLESLANSIYASMLPLFGIGDEKSLKELNFDEEQKEDVKITSIAELRIEKAKEILKEYWSSLAD